LLSFGFLHCAGLGLSAGADTGGFIEVSRRYDREIGDLDEHHVPVRVPVGERALVRPRNSGCCV